MIAFIMSKFHFRAKLGWCCPLGRRLIIPHKRPKHDDFCTEDYWKLWLYMYFVAWNLSGTCPNPNFCIGFWTGTCNRFRGTCTYFTRKTSKEWRRIAWTAARLLIFPRKSLIFQSERIFAQSGARQLEAVTVHVLRSLEPVSNLSKS